ncbi:tRNA-dependent cyclodipeptide synthase [Streptomyces sp. NPDC057702]|uniref:tRNA-dependent cyclodipeptide synthase n=1 Tax=unclassified Streptomyces TaxID=2593676 RepID=UPI0036C27FB2
MTNSNPSTIVPTFITEPLTDNCQSVSARGEHALVGVSPGNSYFSEARMTDLLRWAGSQFRRVDVMVPDSARVNTWLAVGYERDQAERKARGEASRLYNRAARAWQAADVPGLEGGLHRLSEIEKRPSYQALLRESEDLIASDTATRESYDQVVRQVLRNYLQGAEPTVEQTSRAAKYLIAETPFLINTPTIMGVGSSTAIYQHRMDFLDRIYTGQTALRRSEQQAFVIARPTS